MCGGRWVAAEEPGSTWPTHSHAAHCDTYLKCRAAASHLAQSIPSPGNHIKQQVMVGEY